MKRLGWWLWCAVLLAGCTVPDIVDLEKDKPFACDVAHSCADGYRCVAGACVARGSGDGGTVLGDGDGDGHAPPSSGGEDCDDTLASVHPGAAETCNGRDDDCDGAQDEGFELGLSCDASGGCQGVWACDGAGGRTCEQRGATPWYPDGDGDSYGARDATPVLACVQPTGHVADNADCDDTTRLRRPGALELCNAVDEDCDGDPANGFNLNAACTQGPCSGVRVCVADGGAECGATPLSRFRDSDNDGFGARNTAPVTLCQQPDGGYAVDAGDCDDTNPSRYPGAPERCNGLDDNCDFVSDDTAFSLDAGCAPDGGCTGARACDGDGGVTCRTLTVPTRYYPDEDLDTFGDTSAPVPLCSPPDGGLLARAGDCDDGDPFTYFRADELCDGRDNDCNGSVDGTGVCPAGAAWTPSTVGDSTRTWYRAALWGNGNLWVVGSGGGRVERQAGEFGFTVYESGCEGDWYSVLVNPVSGRAYFGGAGGKLATQDPKSGFCIPSTLDSTDSVTGLWGESGGVEMLGVGATPEFTVGRTFVWGGGSTGRVTGSVEAPLYSMHGVSSEALFAVGGPTTEPRVYRYFPVLRDWRRDTSLSTSGLDALRDVHVVHSKLAYAVSHNGGVAKWNGTGWQRMAGPSTGTDLQAVLAFGTSSVYVVSEGGSIYRFDGSTWRQLVDFEVPLWDIAGTSPDNLWVVGEKGLIIHWPTR